MLIITHFLVQVSYTRKSWGSLVKQPQNRLDHMQIVIKNLKGKIENAFLTFGDYDVVGILDLPDNLTAAALSMALMAGGGIKNIKTTPMLAWEDGVKAMKIAKKASYKPPENNPMIDRK